MEYVQKLKWDSEFFGLEIGSANIKDFTETSISEVLYQARRKNFKLIYLMDSEVNSVLPESLNFFDCKLVDTKVVYSKIPSHGEQVDFCRRYKISDDLDNIYFLGLESGQYSRFKIDKHFKPTDFERFYNTWIDNSISGEIADDFVVFELENKIVGFVTIRYKEEHSQIGLIAVSPNERSKGIGRSLIQFVEKATLDNGLKYITVATQLENKDACRFYEKQGMHIIEKVNIYHIWL